MREALTRHLDINAAPRRAMLVALAEMAQSPEDKVDGCVCICVCICVPSRIYVYIYVYIYADIYIRIYMCVYIYIHVHIHACINASPRRAILVALAEMHESPEDKV